MQRFGLAIVAVIIFLSNVNSQRNIQVTKEQLALFSKSTTYVAWDDNPVSGYNIAIKAAMDKFWKITPFKYVSVSEFDSLRNDSTKSFLILTKVTLTKDESGAEYQYINLLMGKKVTSINDLPEILTLPIHYTGVDESTYSYKLGVMVCFAQEHVKTLLGSKRIAFYRNLKYYNWNAKEMKDKTLLLTKADLAPEVDSEEKIKAVYPYKFKIVKPEDIENAVIKQTPNTLILHQISPGENDNIGRSYKMIFGVDNNKMYYYNFENISIRRPTGMLAKDFKRIAGM